MLSEKFVTYEQFGAVGDGVNDDMPAIVAAHAYANEKGLPVKAKDGANYYIGGRALIAIIKTDTDFGEAIFTIDDTVELENRRVSLFRVESDFEPYTPEITSIAHGQKKLDFPHEGRVFIKVVGEQKIYIRYGLNQNSGDDACDVFTVDADGNIEQEINWDYPTIKSIYARRADDKPITLKGGIFRTVANQCESKYIYHWRNMTITRCNVTVDGLKYEVVGELDHGAPYCGFITGEECMNLVIKNCLLAPHFAYSTESKIPGKMVRMGSYALSLTSVINVRFENLKQTKDITDSNYWGLMGSNYCKNVELVDCVISRFDAHCGVTNGSIKNCKLGYHGCNLIGFGKFTIEDTEISAGYFVNLRDDYGSFFHGELEIKNCIWNAGQYSVSIIHAVNGGEHDFGYPCAMPEKITIDGLHIRDSVCKKRAEFAILAKYDQNYAPNKPFKYGTPKTLVIKNITSETGKDIPFAIMPEMYEGIEIK